MITYASNLGKKQNYTGFDQAFAVKIMNLQIGCMVDLTNVFTNLIEFQSLQSLTIIPEITVIFPHILDLKLWPNLKCLTLKVYEKELNERNQFYNGHLKKALGLHIESSNPKKFVLNIVMDECTVSLRELLDEMKMSTVGTTYITVKNLVVPAYNKFDLNNQKF